MQAARRVGYPRRKDKDAAFNDDGDGGAICGGVKFPELGTDTGHSSVCSTKGLSRPHSHHLSFVCMVSRRIALESYVSSDIHCFREYPSQ